MRSTITGIACALIAALQLAGCVVDEVPVTELFPSQVGEFLRTSGPGPHPTVPEVQQATYTGPGGSVLLYVRRVGSAQVEQALAELPPAASNVGYDPALGQREGVFFTFAEEYHAAWANADWVFVLLASSEAGRLAFISAYGY